jgi:nitrate/nitrite transporter NarK
MYLYPAKRVKICKGELAMPSAPASYKIYPYRWVILAVFMLINLTIQIEWICFAPITGPAASYYHVSDLQIGILAMSFMVVYIPLSIPISWLIDTLGYRKSVSIGAVLMAVFALLRGAFAADYNAVLVTTLGVAIAQPFLLNAVSTVAAKWFPIGERATASGLSIVAGFIGVALGQLLSPGLMQSSGIPAMLTLYGLITAASTVIFLVFTREAPPTPPCPPELAGRALVLDGLKSMLRLKDIWFLIILFLVGMGIFNGVSTWIENIVRPRGFTPNQAGDFGAFLLLGGIIGAIVIPLLSDKIHKRKIFLLIGMTLAVPGMLGFTFAASYELVVVSALVLGFFLMSLAPIGYQYAAEITYPAPEGSSNGLLNLAGQASVIFIYGMDAIKGSDGTFTVSLVIMLVLMVVSSLLISVLKESRMISAQTEKL